MFRTLETFLVSAAENLSNKIFCLGLVRQEKPPGRPEKPAGPAWPLRNTDPYTKTSMDMLKQWQDEVEKEKTRQPSM
jgi:hypothetical protein